MSGSNDLDFIESQLTLARWHLDQLEAGESEQGVDHSLQARRAYEASMDLLPTLSISGKRRVRLVTELAALRDRLRQHGEGI
jgi:hypothetical protein